MKKCIFFLLLLAAAMIFTTALAKEDTSQANRAPDILPAEPSGVLELPASLQSIEDEAFEGTAIREVTLPDSVAYIGERAFANITSLCKIQIPAATKSIANNAFAQSNHVIISAAADSYARKYAKANGLPFAPITFLCTGVERTSQTEVNVDKSRERIEQDPPGTTDAAAQWRKVAETEVTGNTQIYENLISGRAPPAA